MKLIIKTTNIPQHDHSTTYITRLPNYFDVESVAQLVDDLRSGIPLDETIVEYHLYSDDMPTQEERKEIDIYGKIVSKHVELRLPENA
jgi:hypothetical protein